MGPTVLLLLLVTLMLKDSLLNIVEACGVSYDISRNATVIPVITNHQMNLTTVCIRCVLDETGLTSIHPEAVHYSSNGYPINSSTGDLSVVDNKLIINHPTRILTDQQTLECYMNVSLLKHFIVFSFQEVFPPYLDPGGDGGTLVYSKGDPVSLKCMDSSNTVVVRYQWVLPDGSRSPSSPVQNEIYLNFSRADESKSGVYTCISVILDVVQPGLNSSVTLSLKHSQALTPSVRIISSSTSMMQSSSHSMIINPVLSSNRASVATPRLVLRAAAMQQPPTSYKSVINFPSSVTSSSVNSRVNSRSATVSTPCIATGNIQCTKLNTLTVGVSASTIMTSNPLSIGSSTSAASPLSSITSTDRVQSASINTVSLTTSKNASSSFIVTSSTGTVIPTSTTFVSFIPDTVSSSGVILISTSVMSSIANNTAINGDAVRSSTVSTSGSNSTSNENPSTTDNGASGAGTSSGNIMVTSGDNTITSGMSMITNGARSGSKMATGRATSTVGNIVATGGRDGITTSRSTTATIGFSNMPMTGGTDYGTNPSVSIIITIILCSIVVLIVAIILGIALILRWSKRLRRKSWDIPDLKKGNIFSRNSGAVVLLRMRPLDSTSQWSAVNPNFDVESDEEMMINGNLSFSTNSPNSCNHVNVIIEEGNLSSVSIDSLSKGSTESSELEKDVFCDDVSPDTGIIDIYSGLSSKTSRPTLSSSIEPIEWSPLHCHLDSSGISLDDPVKSDYSIEEHTSTLMKRSYSISHDESPFNYDIYNEDDEKKKLEEFFANEGSQTTRTNEIQTEEETSASPLNGEESTRNGNRIESAESETAELQHVCAGNNTEEYTTVMDRSQPVVSCDDSKPPPIIPYKYDLYEVVDVQTEGTPINGKDQSTKNESRVQSINESANDGEEYATVRERPQPVLQKDKQPPPVRPLPYKYDLYEDVDVKTNGIHMNGDRNEDGLISERETEKNTDDYSTVRERPPPIAPYKYDIYEDIDVKTKDTPTSRNQPTRNGDRVTCESEKETNEEEYATVMERSRAVVLHDDNGMATVRPFNYDLCEVVDIQKKVTPTNGDQSKRNGMSASGTNTEEYATVMKTSRPVLSDDEQPPPVISYKYDLYEVVDMKIKGTHINDNQSTRNGMSENENVNITEEYATVVRKSHPVLHERDEQPPPPIIPYKYDLYEIVDANGILTIGDHKPARNENRVKSESEPDENNTDEYATVRKQPPPITPYKYDIYEDIDIKDGDTPTNGKQLTRNGNRVTFESEAVNNTEEYATVMKRSHSVPHNEDKPPPIIPYKYDLYEEVDIQMNDIPSANGGRKLRPTTNENGNGDLYTSVKVRDHHISNEDIGSHGDKTTPTSPPPPLPNRVPFDYRLYLSESDSITEEDIDESLITTITL